MQTEIHDLREAETETYREWAATVRRVWESHAAVNESPLADLPRRQERLTRLMKEAETTFQKWIAACRTLDEIEAANAADDSRE